VKDLLLKEIREILYIKKLEMEFKSYDQSEKRVLEKGKKIRVFAVEDNSSYQRVLKTIIRRAGDMRIVGIESTGVDAIEKIKNLPEPPDVVITNIAMPVMNGILMTLELLTIYPDMKIIIISALADKIHILSAFKAGVVAYLRKDAGMCLILKTIRNVARGIEPPWMDDIAIHFIKNRQEIKVPAKKSNKIRLFIINKNTKSNIDYFLLFKNYREFEFSGQTYSSIDAIKEIENIGILPDFFIINGENLERLDSTLRILLSINPNFKIILTELKEEKKISKLYKTDSIYFSNGNDVEELADFIKKNSDTGIQFQPELLNMKNVIEFLRKSMKEREKEKNRYVYTKEREEERRQVHKEKHERKEKRRKEIVHKKSWRKALSI